MRTLRSFVVLLAVVALGVMACGSPAANTPGQERRLRPAAESVLVMAPKPSDLNELLIAMNRNDKVRLQQLFDSGRLVDWQVEGGKRVAVLDHDYGTKATNVRLLEGPEVGHSGWMFDTALAP